MRRLSFRKLFTGGILGLLVFSLLASIPIHNPSQASSHREAPLRTSDPLADNTDVYSFRSTESGREGFVTLISNFIPFQEPSGGPHFYLFDDTVLYEIKIDNNGDGVEDISYQFRFTTEIVNPNTALGMAAVNEDGVIRSLTDPDFNERQRYTVSRRDNTTGKSATVIASGLRTPPSNVGQRATPNYAALAQQAVSPLPNGGQVFAGQRDEGFTIDLGGVFDIFNLSAIDNAPNFDQGGFGTFDGFNVNTIAIEVPIQALTRDGQVPSSTTAANAVIGVWSTASRQTTRVIRPARRFQSSGPFAQVSRLGNPLVNELIVPLGLKDTFNTLTPASDAVLVPVVLDPELPRNIRTALSLEGININIPPAPRTDLAQIFALGIPAGSVPGAPTFTTVIQGTTGPHEYQRLNLAIPPSANPSRLGLLGNDPAGFPNGRRVDDDVVDIELRAVLGGTPFTPAFNVFPNNAIGDGVDRNDVPFLTVFPYLGTPHSGNIRGSRPHDHHLPRPLPSSVITP